MRSKPDDGSTADKARRGSATVHEATIRYLDQDGEHDTAEDLHPSRLDPAQSDLDDALAKRSAQRDARDASGRSMAPTLKIRAQDAHAAPAANRLAPYLPPLSLRAVEPAASMPTMRSMTRAEIDAFVSTQGFGVLSLADGNRAYGAPLFYGAREGAIYFQTRQGEKSRYLYATSEACLTISSARGGQGEWASAQLLGRLERVDVMSSATVAGSAIVGVPPPLPWADEDDRSDEPRRGGVTTFRLIPTKRVGRYSQAAKLEGTERHAGF